MKVKLKFKNKALLFLIAAINGIEHAQVCDCTHNQDEQRRAQSQAKARASLAVIPQYHEPLARAYQLAGQYQPQQSSETQMCKPARCQCASQPCGGSSRGM